MKSITKKIALAAVGIGIATALQSLPTLAEGFERPWKSPESTKNTYSKGLLNSLLPSKTKPVRPAAPVSGTINITQPKLTDRKLVIKKTKPKKKRSKRSVPVVPLAVAQKRSNRKKAKKEANWWETIGNPAVYAFRDCSVEFARLQVEKGVTAPPATVITSAMKSTCQVEFAKMAGVMMGGLGEKKSNAMLIELAKTTFLPSVKTAMAEENSVQQAKARQVSKVQSLGTAKAEMFRCFSDRTDRLSVAKNTQANTIADAVLIGCQKQSDVFFELLFANSKASPQVKLQQKNIALNETYKIAIIRRVLVSRKPSQIKTAIQQ